MFLKHLQIIHNYTLANEYKILSFGVLFALSETQDLFKTLFEQNITLFERS